MFSLKYNDTFIDLAPNQSCEIERISPFFVVDSFLAEYSTPITISYSDNNAKTLGWYFFQPTVRKRQTFNNVEIYDNGTYKCNATLVVESAGLNRRFKDASTASGYLYIGISDFLQLIQKKKLKELSLGGDRVFSYTTGSAFDGTNGWWQHLHATWNGTYDYVFAPCRNDNWTGITDDPFATGFMNALDVSTNSFTTLKFGEPVVPFVYVKFILESIFEESGWTVDFSGIKDAQWQTLLLWSVKPLYAFQRSYQTNPSTQQLEAVNTPFPKLTIHLADHMPDYTCSQFISAICSRYGWAIIPNTSTRVCRFVAFKSQKKRDAKDWTQYASEAANTTITKDQKIFAFKNDFEGSDQTVSQPDFTNLSIGRSVNTIEELPPNSSGAYDNTVVYVFKENQYYHVVSDETNTARIWQVFADNIYDVNPPDGYEATDTFETKCTTLPVYKTSMRTDNTPHEWFMWFPLCSQSMNEAFGIKTFFYLGKCKEINESAQEGTYTYPFASSNYLRHDLTSDPNHNWSNVHSHVDLNNVDHGIVSYWFQDWLDITSSVEDNFVGRYFLPLYELLNFKWDDVIIDENVPFMITKLVEPLPYTGFIECTMQRLSFDKYQPVVATAPVDQQQTVYLRIATLNEKTGQRFDKWSGSGISQFDEVYANARTADIIVSAYEDAAGTIPLSTPGITFQTTNQTFKNGTLDSTTTQAWTMNSNQINVNSFSSEILEADYTKFWFTNSNGTPHTYILAEYHLLNTIQLLPGPTYTIIP